MKKSRIEGRSRESVRGRSELELIRIVQEIQNGIIGIRAACLKYGLNRGTLRRHIVRLSVSTLSHELSKDFVSGMTQNEKSIALEKKVAELTKALELSRLKTESLEIMIKVAEEDLNIKIRKKHGTKQLKE